MLVTFLFQVLACTAPASFGCPHELYLGVLQEDGQWLQVFSVPPAIPVHFAGGCMGTCTGGSVYRLQREVVLKPVFIKHTWHVLLVVSGTSYLLLIAAQSPINNFSRN